MWSAWSLSSRCIRNSHRRASSSRGTQTTDSSSGSRAGSVRRSLVVAVAAGTAFASLALIGLSSATVASAATSGAPAVAQCNPPDFPITAGFQVTCTVAVVNARSSSGATSSTVTTSACLAAAGVPFPSCPLNLGPVTSTTSSTQLVTSVNQCNGIVTGGGSNVYCNVTVTNNVPVGTSTAAVTVDQCVGSGGGGGSTEICAPTGSTTTATVTQCNGSGTGGGTYAGETTVGCTVTGGTSALPVTVNQCNGTATGGGSAVTCMSTFNNNFIPAATTTTTTTPASTSGTGGSGTTATPGASGVTPAGSGVTGLTGSASGAGGSTGLVGTVGAIPSGAPQTGFGGASRSRDGDLMFAGVIALIGAGLALTIAVRRRRTFCAQGANETP
jgi:hypothetical protein